MDVITRYEYVCKKIEELEDRLSKIKNTGTALEYANIIEEINNLNSTKEKLYPKYKMATYDTCDHITVVTFSDCGYDFNCICQRCVKCGLDDSILYGYGRTVLHDCSEQDVELMKEHFLSNGNPIQGLGFRRCLGPIYQADYCDMADLYNNMKRLNSNLTDYEYISKCVEELHIPEYYIEKVAERDEKKAQRKRSNKN